MAQINTAPIMALLCVILALTSMPTSECFQKAVSIPREEDVQCMKCQVCQKLASQLNHPLQNKQARNPPEKMTEKEIHQIAQNLCDLPKEEDDCIRKIEIVKQGDKSEQVDRGTEGICNSDCRTIDRACQEFMMELNGPFVELYNGKDSFLCGNLTQACKYMTSPASKGTPSTERFNAKQDDGETKRLSSEPGEVLGEEESRKSSWNLKKRIQKPTEALGRGLIKVFHPGNWWPGTRKSDSKRNSKTHKEL